MRLSNGWVMHAYDMRPRGDKRGVIAGVAIVGGWRSIGAKMFRDSTRIAICFAHAYAHARENGGADCKRENDLRHQARKNIRTPLAACGYCSAPCKYAIMTTPSTKMAYSKAIEKMAEFVGFGGTALTWGTD
jgi:hypothetical protein